VSLPAYTSDFPTWTGTVAWDEDIPSGLSPLQYARLDSFEETLPRSASDLQRASVVILSEPQTMKWGTLEFLGMPCHNHQIQESFRAPHGIRLVHCLFLTLIPPVHPLRNTIESEET
jgi:hypothetical protein